MLNNIWISLQPFLQEKLRKAGLGRNLLFALWRRSFKTVDDSPLAKGTYISKHNRTWFSKSWVLILQNNDHCPL